MENQRIVTFGDVVRNVDESVHDTLTCGLERYVGFDYIDPESLHFQHMGIAQRVVGRIIPPQNLNRLKRQFQWTEDNS